jgi:hypothetical protein
MEKLYRETVCVVCKTASLCLDLPCKHYPCKKCYTDYYRPRVAAIYGLICQNVEQYNGKSTCLCCTFNCDASQLTVDPNTLIELFRAFGDDDSVNYVACLKLFFSGITTFFYFCHHCQMLHTDTVSVDLCPIIKERYVPEFDKRTKKLLEEYKNPVHSFEFVDLGESSNIQEDPKFDFLIMLDNAKQPKTVGNMATRLFKLSRNNAQNCSYFALASIKFLDQNDCLVNVKQGEKPLIKAIYSITNTNDARLGIKNIIEDLMKTNNMRFRYEFIKNCGSRLQNDRVVNETGVNVLLLIGENKDVIYEKVGSNLKIYKLCQKYLNPNREFTVGKAVVVEADNEEFIVIEQLDMLAFSQIFRVTAV